MKLEDLDLDFDFNVEPSGKGSKMKALKDMGIHNQDFIHWMTCTRMNISKTRQTTWVVTQWTQFWNMTI